LIGKSNIAWGEGQRTTNNINLSLTFGVDAFGGGVYREYPLGDSYGYSGDLADFTRARAIPLYPLIVGLCVVGLFLLFRVLVVRRVY